MFIFCMSSRAMPDPSLLPQGGRICASLKLYEDAHCSAVNDSTATLLQWRIHDYSL